MGKRIKLVIPDAPETEQPLEKERRRIKIRRNWTRNPVTQVVPNKKKNLEEQSFSNRGNLRKQIESELDENETQ
jgi:hypothetical protein